CVDFRPHHACIVVESTRATDATVFGRSRIAHLGTVLPNAAWYLVETHELNWRTLRRFGRRNQLSHFALGYRHAATIRSNSIASAFTHRLHHWCTCNQAPE